MKRALLLNADYSPLHFISDLKAVTLLLKERAEVITGEEGRDSVWDEYFTTTSNKIQVPATLRLKRRINKKWKTPRFRKKVLFNRDEWRCQYCSISLDWTNITIDHVLPSSRGGRTTWLNCVVACKSCNKKKANKTPEEANMKLLKRPAEPTTLHFWDVLKSSARHPDWNIYLPQ